MTNGTNFQDFDFESDTTRFSWKNAHCCAMASSLAYKPEDEIRNQAATWQADCEFIQSNGTQAFVLSTDDLVLVAFRGTEPTKVEDWLTDLDLALVDGPLEGRVHGGFYSALADVWQRIERTIPKFMSESNGLGGRRSLEKSLWLTGHSLGAALATLAAARMRAKDRPVDGLYTFGQPRTGDRLFALNLNFELKPFMFRFVNNNDVVTRVPPRSLRYSHAGTFRYFDEDGKFHEDIGRWNRFLDRMKGRFEDLFEWGSDGIKDHDMARYLERVRAML